MMSWRSMKFWSWWATGSTASDRTRTGEAARGALVFILYLRPLQADVVAGAPRIPRRCSDDTRASATALRLRASSGGGGRFLPGVPVVRGARAGRARARDEGDAHDRGQAGKCRLRARRGCVRGGVGRSVDGRRGGRGAQGEEPRSYRRDRRCLRCPWCWRIYARDPMAARNMRRRLLNLPPRPADEDDG